MAYKLSLGSQVSLLEWFNFISYITCLCAVVYNAADAAMQLLIKETGRKDLSLRDVPLNTLRVFFGRQHHVGVSIDGIQYEVVLGNDQDLQQQAAAALALPASEQVPHVAHGR